MLITPEHKDISRKFTLRHARKGRREYWTDVRREFESEKKKLDFEIQGFYIENLDLQLADIKKQHEKVEKAPPSTRRLHKPVKVSWKWQATDPWDPEVVRPITDIDDVKTLLHTNTAQDLFDQRWLDQHGTNLKRQIDLEEILLHDKSGPARRQMADKLMMRGREGTSWGERELWRIRRHGQDSRWHDEDGRLRIESKIDRQLRLSRSEKQSTSTQHSVTDAEKEKKRSERRQTAERVAKDVKHEDRMDWFKTQHKAGHEFCRQCGKRSILVEVSAQLPTGYQSQGSVPACTFCGQKYWSPFTEDTMQPDRYQPLVGQVQSEFFAEGVSPSIAPVRRERFSKRISASGRKAPELYLDRRY